MKEIGRHCPSCKKFSLLPAQSNQEVICAHCQTRWGKTGDIERIFERCPVCECRQFYLQKDFNQLLGFGIMGVGIILVPKTFGLSLPVFALLDWLLFKKVKTIAVCYRCATEFHGFAHPEHFKPFMHHIGLKYDKYRT